MIHPDDVVAWLAQVRQNPEAAPAIVEALAARLMELDQQNEALRDELVRLSRGREQPVGTERIAALSRRVQLLERRLEQGGEPIPTAAYLLLFTLDGRGARVPLPDAGAWRTQDRADLIAAHLRPRHLLVAHEDDELLLFSDKGRAMRLSVADIEPVEPPVNYMSLLPDLMLDLDESVSVSAVLAQSFEQLTLVTRKGYVRCFSRVELESFLERGLPLHSSPVEGDYPAFALQGDGRRDTVLATRIGKGVRFPERAVSVQSKPGVQLDRGDVIAGAAIVEDETVLALVGEAGDAAAREMGGFGRHATAGNRGKLLTRIGDVVVVAPVKPDQTVWLLTAAGRLHPVPASRMSPGPGASGGKSVLKLDKDRVVAMTVA
jgi:DNA gyrase/topoisomerase IV subunit A